MKNLKKKLLTQKKKNEKKPSVKFIQSKSKHFFALNKLIKIFILRYKTFDLFFKDVSALFDSWDRTQGTIYRQPSPSEKSDHDDVHVKKTLKKQPDKKNAKDKSDEKAKESEKAKEKEKEKEKEKIKDEQKDQQPDETVSSIYCAKYIHLISFLKGRQ